MALNLRIALIIITLIYLFLVLKKIHSKKLQMSFSTFWIISRNIINYSNSNT